MSLDQWLAGWREDANARFGAAKLSRRDARSTPPFNCEYIGSESGPRDSGDEVTVYVRGFLSQGKDYDRWKQCHARLVNEQGFAPPAYGYTWPSVSTTEMMATVLGLPTLSGASVLAAARLAARAAGSVLTMPLLATQFVGGILGFRSKFRRAHERAETHIQPLMVLLDELGDRYRYVRVVAHSLGCLHFLRAAKFASERGRRLPDEIHLCAAAVGRREFGDLVPDELRRKPLYIYYCERDWVLTKMFDVDRWSVSVGARGVPVSWDGLHSVNVCQYFDRAVHQKYVEKLPDILREQEK
jgi:hypothetical protein